MEKEEVVEVPKDVNPLSILKLLDASDLSSTTGRKTWNAALVTKEYLRRKGVSGKRILDVSSGNGFLAIALLLLGAKKVYATECPKCVKLLQANLTENFGAASAKTKVIEYSWGDDYSKISSSVEEEEEALDTVVFSDLLYICFRDDILSLFETTMLDLLPESEEREGLFCYEARLMEREQNFIDQFLMKHFDVNEVDCGAENLLDACQETEQGEVDCGELSIFYQPPPVRLLILKRKKRGLI